MLGFDVLVVDLHPSTATDGNRDESKVQSAISDANFSGRFSASSAILTNWRANIALGTFKILAQRGKDKSSKRIQHPDAVIITTNEDPTEMTKCNAGLEKLVRGIRKIDPAVPIILRTVHLKDNKDPKEWGVSVVIGINTTQEKLARVIETQIDKYLKTDQAKRLHRIPKTSGRIGHGGVLSDSRGFTHQRIPDGLGFGQLPVQHQRFGNKNRQTI
jgi:hypothetical protein